MPATEPVSEVFFCSKILEEGPGGSLGASLPNFEHCIMLWAWVSSLTHCSQAPPFLPSLEVRASAPP